jgi:hypothetical protein
MSRACSAIGLAPLPYCGSRVKRWVDCNRSRFPGHVVLAILLGPQASVRPTSARTATRQPTHIDRSVLRDARQRGKDSGPGSSAKNGRLYPDLGP